jgi:hypothetical protein
MAAAVTRVTFTMVDRYNQTSKIVLHFKGILTGPTDTAVTVMLGLLNAALNPKGIRIEISIVQGIGGPPISGNYDTVEDKGVLRMIDAGSQSHRWRIPGPVDSIVSGTDHKTIANTGIVATWSAAVITNARGSGGELITAFVNGYRTIERKATKG